MAVSIDGGGGDRKKPLNAELNLVPYIDLLTCMVAFLLITAVWTQLARLKVDQRGQGSIESGEVTPKTRVAVVVHDDGFTSQTNLLNIVRQAGPVTVMAVAVVFVLTAGEIDLSIGSVVALSALVTAKVLQTHGIAPAVGAGLGVGLGVGAVNGLFVTVLRLPSFT
jgi:hypothetical protein